MGKKRPLTLSVLRAIADDSIQVNLAEILEAIRSKLKNGDHIVDRGLWGKTAVKFPQFPRTNHAIAMQFALYEEGAKKSTISPFSNIESYSTASLDAPDNDEFLEHEVVILVDGNYVIACGLSKRQNLLVESIARLAERCDVAFPAASLGFAETPNRLTVERIRAVGVKSVNLDVANLLGSLDIPKQSLIGTVFGAGSSVNDLDRKEMVAALKIERKSRKRIGLEYEPTPKSEWLADTAVRTLNEDQIDSFTITLEDDTTWQEGELKLTKKIYVSRNASSFNVAEALQEMLNYRDELVRGGFLV